MNKIISKIDNQILELGSIKTIFGTKTNRFEDFVSLERIDSKIKSTKRAYYLYLLIGSLGGIFLCAACIAQSLDMKFLDLSKSGMLIFLTIVNLVTMNRYRIDLERLRVIKSLLELKNSIE